MEHSKGKPSLPFPLRCVETQVGHHDRDLFPEGTFFRVGVCSVEWCDVPIRPGHAGMANVWTWEYVDGATAFGSIQLSEEACHENRDDTMDALGWTKLEL